MYSWPPRGYRQKDRHLYGVAARRAFCLGRRRSAQRGSKYTPGILRAGSPPNNVVKRTGICTAGRPGVTAKRTAKRTGICTAWLLGKHFASDVAVAHREARNTRPVSSELAHILPSLKGQAFVPNRRTWLTRRRTGICIAWVLGKHFASDVAVAHREARNTRPVSSELAHILPSLKGQAFVPNRRTWLTRRRTGICTAWLLGKHFA